MYGCWKVIIILRFFRNKKLDKVIIVVSNLGGNINGFKVICIRSLRLVEIRC